MSIAVALLSSPLLGPASWQPVADVLERRGRCVTVVAHTGPAPRSAAEVADAFVAPLDAAQEWVLVPHSNAGLFAPAVARRRRVRGVVYVDARLPQPGVHPMSSADSLAFVAPKADRSGVLPPWHAWWDDDIGQLFPTESCRRTCEAEMRPLPLAYYTDRVDGTGCDELPSAYLAFGDVYAAERRRAVEAGWPTATVEQAQHLHMLMDAGGVASLIEGLMAAIGVAEDG